MKRFSVLVLLMILSLLIIQPAASTPITAKGILIGTVSQGSTNDPVAGANVTVSSNQNQSSFAVTGTSGRFIISPLATGTASIAVNKQGYQSYTGKVVVIASATTQIAITLIPVIPPPQGGIQGTVTDASTGNPIIGARINVLPGSAPNIDLAGPCAMTDSTGHYDLANLAIGTTVAVCSKEGYQYSLQTVAIVANTQTQADFVLPPITVTVSTTTTNPPAPTSNYSSHNYWKWSNQWNGQ